MRTLVFDGRMGASGDMLLGALVAAGANRAALAPVEASLPVRYAVESVDRAGIAATQVAVIHEEAADDADEAGEPAAGSDVPHDHDHDHETAHDHDHDHHASAEGHGPSRTFAEVVDVVEGMDLPSDVTEDAVAVFRLLGEAEAAVHGTTLAETHFHEVGADDAIADIVGVTLLLADLAVDRVVTTPVHAGSGEVTMAHGSYPVPPPAVVEIAERAEWSLQGGPVEGELLTPTGAALLAHYADGVSAVPALRFDASGYGAGTRTYPDRPNVLRASIGEDIEPASHSANAAASGLRRDPITVLETTVDDVSPEVLGGLHETLAAVGARDVAVIPAMMKKSRPGHVIQVITKPEDSAAVARRLAQETGTLGIREGAASHRWIADRELRTATIAINGTDYEVAVKVAMDDEGTVYDVSAEYDDAASVARETGLPIRAVMDQAEAAVDVGE